MRKLFCVAVILTVLFSFFAFTPVSAQSPPRAVNFSTPATINQVSGSPIYLGNDRWVTSGEILIGSTDECADWPALSSATIEMDNTTYFKWDQLTGEVQGFSYATITFTATDGGTLTVYAFGPMKGNMYFASGVDSTMYWTSTESSGSLSCSRANGQIQANFIWTPAAQGTGTISGRYQK